ncbi:hypothetical protein ACFS07_34190 [Undibacterium arcticum]
MGGKFHAVVDAVAQAMARNEDGALAQLIGHAYLPRIRGPSATALEILLPLVTRQQRKFFKLFKSNN